MIRSLSFLSYIPLIVAVYILSGWRLVYLWALMLIDAVDIVQVIYDRIDNSLLKMISLSRHAYPLSFIIPYPPILSSH